ncbi:COMM domain-containing protein 7, partial [Galemys pyrenaicus]
TEKEHSSVSHSPVPACPCCWDKPGSPLVQKQGLAGIRRWPGLAGYRVAGGGARRRGGPWRKCGCGSAARRRRAAAQEKAQGRCGAAGRVVGAMGRLHCTQDPVPEAVGGDMQQLNQLSAQQFSALTEVLFRFLTEPKEVKYLVRRDPKCGPVAPRHLEVKASLRAVQVERFLAQLSEFATSNQISLGPLKSIVKSLLLVPNGALKKSLSAEQVRADFITLGLREEKATYFSEKWKKTVPTLAHWAIGQTLMINQLVDMEWKFGVTSGSSELEKVGSIFLQVSLPLIFANGYTSEGLNFLSPELTLPQFYSFLHEMERVRTSMECFS